MKSKLFQNGDTTLKVSLVKQGEKYGHDVIHNEADPLVEFYDPHNLVRRYYLSTLLDIEDGQGLVLEGGRYDYLSVEGSCLDRIKRWAIKSANL